MTNDERERVAIALFDNSAHYGLAWEHTSELVKNLFRVDATVAIQALRETD